MQAMAGAGCFAAALIVSPGAQAQDASAPPANTPLESTPPASAAQPALIREIVYEGNEHTQPETMQRELKIAVGDPADPAKIEASRQAIQDLGLFKRVSVREEPLPEGGERVVFRVHERYYLLPLPRFDAKSDGRYSYGAQMRWDNMWGLNHSLRLLWLEEDAKEQGIGRQTEYSAAYSIPFVDGSPYGLNVYGGYRTRPVDNDDGTTYDESFRDAGFMVSRHLGGPPASQGWRVSAGIDYEDESTSGPYAQPAYGTAISPTFGIRYRDWHYRIFSDVGQQFALNYAFASRTLGSDYHYQRITANYNYATQIGETPHQTLAFNASTGLYYGNPEDLHPFGLGGSDSLRGYDVNFREGDAFWLLQLEFARPLYEPWPWLRGVVILETGNVMDQAEHFELDSPRSCLDIGLRIRFKNFVNFEFEAGYAIPLNGGGGRVFASKV